MEEATWGGEYIAAMSNGKWKKELFSMIFFRIKTTHWFTRTWCNRSIHLTCDEEIIQGLCRSGKEFLQRDLCEYTSYFTFSLGLQNNFFFAFDGTKDRTNLICLIYKCHSQHTKEQQASGSCLLEIQKITIWCIHTRKRLPRKYHIRFIY